MYDISFYKQPSYKTSKPQPISKALEIFLSNKKWLLTYESKKLKSEWKRIVGDFVATQTEKVEIRRGKLFVRVVQPTLRYELNMTKSSIIQKVNTHFGKIVVEEMILI